MQRPQARILLCLFALIAATSGRLTADDSKKTDLKSPDKLVGTWKLVKAMYGGKEVPIPQGTTQIKHITQTHFMFVDYDKDGKFIDAFGGPYTLNGVKYEETPEYGTGDAFSNIRGKSQLFECRVEGDKWFHKGTLSSGLTIDEVWERVKKEK